MTDEELICNLQFVKVFFTLNMSEMSIWENVDYDIILLQFSQTGVAAR